MPTINDKDNQVAPAAGSTDVEAQRPEERAAGEAESSGEDVTEEKTAESLREVTKERKACCVDMLSSKENRRRCYALTCCLGFGLVLFGAFVGVFWPRNPSWELTKLEMGPDALQDLMKAALGKIPEEDNKIRNLDFTAYVDIYNPNMLGGMATPGSFTITFEGHTLGWGQCQELRVRPRSNMVAIINVSIALRPSLGRAIGKVAMANKFKLPIQAGGSAQVMGAGFLPMMAEVNCDITADVIQLVPPHRPEDVVKKHDCNYRYYFSAR